MKKYLAEFLATFTLVFVGVGAIMMQAHTGGGVGWLGIALAHGLAIGLMVCVTGHISGGHINPAVTISMLATKHIGLKDGGLYIVSQLLGACFGVWLLSIAFPAGLAAAVNFGTPALTAGFGFGTGILLEAVLTFFLVLVIFATTLDSRGPKNLAPFAIGLAITMGILIGGPITGGAMNPARYFGPALLSGNWMDCGVYWAGPLLGGLLAGLVYDRFLKN